MVAGGSELDDGASAAVENFFFRSRFFQTRVEGEREKKKRIASSNSSHERQKKKPLFHSSQRKVHPSFNAQGIIDQSQRLEPCHEPPRVAAVVADGEELPFPHVAEEPL